MYYLTSGLYGGEWSASRSSHFTSRERAPVTHCVGGWLDPRAVLDTVVKKNFPGCGISHKDAKHTDKCSKNRTKTTQKQYDETTGKDFFKIL
jgi:Zn-finger nucleic acid-binding protein